MNSVVVHMMVGKLVKGVTHDFHKARPFFHVQTAGTPAKPVEVKVADTKAIFFVRDLNGHLQAGMGHLHEGKPRGGYGRKARLELFDGEILVGYVQAFHQEDPLIMLLPEKEDNNDRVYVNPKSIRKFDWL